VQENPAVVEAYFGSGRSTSGHPATFCGGAPPNERNSPQVENLKVAYGRIEAVRQVDLEIRKGEFVGIIGSNGGGKTSTLRAIAGVKAPSAGTITLAARRSAGCRAMRWSGAAIAMVPEGGWSSPTRPWRTIWCSAATCASDATTAG
jgi:ABC-type dipeptide/oligopeptide/nickel transport system ATPase subunit